MNQFLDEHEIPSWFQYPQGYLRIVDQNLVDLSPWIILQNEQLRTRYDGIRSRYPDRDLVPFARREDNDDVACWEKGNLQKIIVIHDFASPGYEDKEQFSGFWEWFRSAVETMIEYGEP